MSGWLTNGMSLATLPLTGNERYPVDTQLSAGATPEMEAVSMSQAALYLGAGGTVPWVAGRFYGAPPSTTPVAGLTTASVVFAYPLYIPATTIKTVTINVTTAQTGNARAGLYADNGAGYPGNLVVDWGAIGSMAVTGAVTLTTSPSTTLNSGLYWVATIFTASGTYPTVTAITTAYTNPLNAQLGFDTVAHAATVSQAVTGIQVAGTYGALASTFAASATEVVALSTMPIVYMGI